MKLLVFTEKQLLIKFNPFLKTIKRATQIDLLFSVSNPEPRNQYI